jgi:putative hemolysin
MTAMIVALVILILLSAFFSASETAFSSLNKIRIKNLAIEGENKRAKETLKLSENFDKLLITILIGNNLVNILATSLSTLLFVAILQNESLGALVATVVMLLALLVFGEITPKSLSKRHSERVALAVTPYLHAVILIFTPVSYLFTKLTAFLSRNAKDEPTMTEDELVVMIDEIEGEGVLEKREGELIRSAIQFDEITAGEIFTPRVDIVAADVRTGKEEIKRIFTETGYSRIPLYDGTIDRIIGVVSVKDFLKSMDNETVRMSDIIRPVKFVPEATNIAVLLNDLQKSKIHTAIVLDNYGGTLGLISLEDILEELVGEIWDESDEVLYSIVKEGDGTFTVTGEANIFDLADQMGVRFDPEDYTDHSVSGYIHYKLGKIPVKGDVIENDSMKIVVRSVKNRRIREVSVRPKYQEEVEL